MAGFFSRLKSIFSGHSAIDEDFYEELEETLIMGDMGITATEEVMEELRRQVKERHVKETEDCRELLKESIKEQMQVPEDAYDFENQQSVIMVIGVNGVGKTTSVGKLAAIYKKQGPSSTTRFSRCTFGSVPVWKSSAVRRERILPA